MTVSDDHELHTLAGPYVMDAITPQERASFASHLADCAQCRDDVREMREATARLGLAAMLRPRPELKEQTMRAAFRTSQLAPAVDTTPDGEAAPSRPGPVPRRRLAQRVRSFPLSARFALASAALVAAAATGFGLMATNMMEQLHHSERQDHMIASVLNASDAVIFTARVTTGGTATVIMSHHERRLVFTAHGLRPLPGGMGYELWLMGPAGDRPAGMLRPQTDGMAGPAVVSGIKRGDAIGVTVEPAGGSSLPSSTVLVTIRQHG
jgi:anti-sigma-K factor RskA